MKRFLIILLVVAGYSTVSAQGYSLLRGYVTDSMATPLPGVLVRLKDGGGTLTDNAGRYELRLPQGVHRISFQYISYKSVQVDQLINGNTTLNVILEEDANQLKQVTVANKRKDYSYAVIRNAIAEKKKYQTQYFNQKRTIYVKSKEHIIRSKKKEEEEKKEDANTLEAITKKQRDSIPNLHYFEGKFTQYTQPPRGFKQVKEAAKRISSQRTLMYTNTTDADFDFYSNVIQVKKLGDNSYISPLSNATFLSYKFKMLGSDFDGGEKYYRIQVKPRKMGNALFLGEIHIWDKTWRLKYVNLSLPKRSLIVYNQFNVKQHYGYAHGKWILQTENLTWQMKTTSEITNGTANVLYTDYSFDSTYAKRFFNAEVGVTQDSAYERDTSYWATIRDRKSVV